MKTTIRAYICERDARARRIAWRLFLCYGIRPHLICRGSSISDRFAPFGKILSLPLRLPDALFVQALVDQAQASKDDRIAVLYVGNPAVLTAHRAVLERSFVLRCANGSAFEPAVNEEVSAI